MGKKLVRATHPAKAGELDLATVATNEVAEACNEAPRWTKLRTVHDIVDQEQESPEFTHEYLSEGERVQVVLEFLRITKLQGLATRELARRMGTSPAQVCRLLDTDRAGAATVTTLTKFARATGTLLTVMFESPAERELRERVLGQPGESPSRVAQLIERTMQVQSQTGSVYVFASARAGADSSHGDAARAVHGVWSEEGASA